AVGANPKLLQFLAGNDLRPGQWPDVAPYPADAGIARGIIPFHGILQLETDNCRAILTTGPERRKFIVLIGSFILRRGKEWRPRPATRGFRWLRKEPLRDGLGRKLVTLELAGYPPSAHDEDAVADMQHFLQFRRHDDERLALIRQ